MGTTELPTGNFPDLVSEVRTWKKSAGCQLEKLFNDNEEMAQKLEVKHIDTKKREKELRKREKELQKREAKIQKERMHMRAFWKEKKAVENALRLAEEQKREKEENASRVAEEHNREKEELHRKIVDLEKKLNAKQALELAVKVIRESFEDGETGLKDMVREVELSTRIDAIKKELKDKEQDIEDQDRLIQALSITERKSNNELQETRKELINGLKDSHAFIGVKRMGELDTKPFHIAVKREYTGEEAEDKATSLCSLWENYLRDPNWHPFKVIPEGSGHKEMIDKDDERLKGLKDEYGDEVYEAVVTALNEINQYNPSGRFVVRELWNFKEEREARLNEGVSYILQQWNLQKRQRK